MIEPIIALIALSLMEIVLGIDNIVFISVLTGKLPVEQQSSARKLGLLVALVSRILLLCGIFWVAQLTAPVFSLSSIFPVESLKPYFAEKSATHSAHGLVELESEEQDASETQENSEADEVTHAQEKSFEEKAFDEEAWEEFDAVSWRDIILVAGGIFLIYNSVKEIHHEVEHVQDETVVSKSGFGSTLVKIAVMDIVFSLDSVITAVGMAEQLWIMVAAIILAVGVMILFANQVGNFVERNPTVKMLALNFLLLIGVMLLAEGIGTPISKGYIYFAMAFSLMVEFFNTRVRQLREPAASV